MTDAIDSFSLQQQDRSGQEDVLPYGVKDRNLGNFTFDKASGGTITLGGTNNRSGLLTVQTAASSEVVRIDSDGFHGFNSSGVELVNIDSDGFHGFNSSGVEKIRVSANGVEAYGTAANALSFYDVPGGTNFGQIGYLQSINSFYFGSDGGAKLYFFSDNEINFSAENNTDINMLSEKDIFLSADNDVTISALGNDVTINATDDVQVNTGGDFLVNGVPKAAVVKTTQGYRALYCSESPEVWFFDFCYGKKVRKSFWKFWQSDWEIKPDRLFLETIEGGIIVVPTGIKNLVQVWGKRKGFSKIRFEEKTEKEFLENNKFWSKPFIK